MSTDSLTIPVSMPVSASRVFRFTAEESAKYLRIVSDSLAIQRHYHLFLWLNGELQEFLPHEVLISACGDFAARQLKLDIVSAVPGVRTTQLNHCSIDGFVEDLHARWVHGARRPLVLRAADVGVPFGPCTCRLHSVLRDMDSILVHGVRDMRDGYDSLSIALSRGSFTKGGPKERFLALVDLLVPQIDFAFRRVAALPLVSRSGKAFGGGDGLDLSPREQAVLDLICRGKTNFDAAVALDISPFTVKNHLQRIFKKIGVSNRTQAATKYGQALRDPLDGKVVIIESCGEAVLAAS